jgi:hypothetical protein
MNTPNLRTAALQLLEHSELYPGLPVHKPVRVRARLWRYPSFEPFISWTVLDVKGKFFVRRVVWEQTPTPLPQPTTFGSEATFDAKVFSTLAQSLQALSIPPFAATPSIGLDGTRNGIEIADFMSSTHLCWWEEGPESWTPLRLWHERAIAQLEATLPTQTPSARQP